MEQKIKVRRKSFRRLGFVDPWMIIAGIVVTAIMASGAIELNAGILDYYKKQADSQKLVIVSNALMMDVNRNGDQSITCSD